ncbi:MAG: tetratricopeptide repeat protein [Myxococcales bacterium]|nr:tetratricopeptide repeat protein [Myxococcales bacterium]
MDGSTRVGSTTPLPSRGSVPPQILLEPPPVLQLVREERVAMTAPRVSRDRLVPRWQAPGRPVDAPTPRVDAAEDAADDAPSADTEPRDDDASDDVEYAEGEVRHIVVRRRRFATPEDLIRAAIRNAESRRPRDLHGDRMLLRASGAVCHCDGDITELARVQAVMRALVVEARPGLKQCLGEAIAEDPRVIVKAPMTLVMTQAMLFDALVYRFTPEFEVGPEGLALKDVGWPGELPRELATCVETAFADAGRIDTSHVRAPHRVRLPLVGFSQHHFSAGEKTRSIHWMLSLQAAQLGWLHFDRGDVAQALEFFEDAYWAYHEGEYQYLIGLAHERLGDHERAAAAYEAFVLARPYAPEVAELRERIDRLRGTVVAAADL